MCQCGCSACDIYSDIASSEKGGWANWEDTVRKFPLVLRCNVGGKVEFWGNLTDKVTGIITAVDREKCFLRVKSVGTRIVRHEDVIRWPMDFEAEESEE